MEEKITLNAAGTEITITAGENADYIKALVDNFNADVTEMQISHTKATKVESIIMCALNYLDDKKKLEAEVVKLRNGRA